MLNDNTTTFAESFAAAIAAGWQDVTGHANRLGLDNAPMCWHHPGGFWLAYEKDKGWHLYDAMHLVAAAGRESTEWIDTAALGWADAQIELAGLPSDRWDGLS